MKNSLCLYMYEGSHVVRSSTRMSPLSEALKAKKVISVISRVFLIILFLFVYQLRIKSFISEKSVEIKILNRHQLAQAASSSSSNSPSSSAVAS